jgi:hypothetical protein
MINQDAIGDNCEFLSFLLYFRGTLYKPLHDLHLPFGEVEGAKQQKAFIGTQNQQTAYYLGAPFLGCPNGESR